MNLQQNNNQTIKLRDAQKYPNLMIKKIEDGKIYQICINRPQYRNAVNPETAQELYNIFIEFDKDPKSKIAIFTSEGDLPFCAGYDLQFTAKGQEQLLGSTFEQWKYFQNIAPMGPSRLQLTKPVIGAVKDYAVAGGLELSLFCDMIVSHKEAVFGVFCRRFGVPLLDGGTVRLGKVIGANRARDLILTGRGVKGDEAYSWGLVNRLVDRNQVIEEAINVAKLIISHPEICMRSDRRSFNEVMYPQLERDFMNEFRIGLEPLIKGETFKGAQNFALNKAGRHGSDIKAKL